MHGIYCNCTYASIPYLIRKSTAPTVLSIRNSRVCMCLHFTCVCARLTSIAAYYYIFIYILLVCAASWYIIFAHFFRSALSVHLVGLIHLSIVAYVMVLFDDGQTYCNFAQNLWHFSEIYIFAYPTAVAACSWSLLLTHSVISYSWLGIFFRL